jgi:hypothetical protein
LRLDMEPEEIPLQGSRSTPEQNDHRGQKLDASYHREWQYVAGGGISESTNNGRCECEDRLINEM